MAFKYKLKEQEKRNVLKPKDVSPAFLKRLEDLYGPIDTERDFFSSDLDTYYKTNPRTKDDIETGAVSHKVIPLASFEESLKKITSSYEALKDLLKTDEAKNDSNIQDVAKDIKEALNKYRAHLRKFYPEQYRQAMSRIDEATGIDGDVMDLNPSNKTKASNYVKLPHHLAAVLLDLADELMADEAGTIGSQPQIKQALSLLRKAAEKAMTGKKEVEEVSTSGAAGAYNTPFAFKLKKKKQKDIVPEGSNDPGASLGPGPKAGADGVSNSAYTKQFKYRLVPKTKNGTYVQKGSGMIVKNLF